jgi:peptide/nickel transport system permease protein
VLPVFCLSYASLAWLSRYVRSGMLEALGQDYVRTARAKGLPERAVIARHALRNALIPLVTLLGLSVPHLIGGSVIVEQVFGVPGMGRLGFQAVLTRDYNTLMAVTTLTALLTMAGTLLSDLAYALVDPRIRCS